MGLLLLGMIATFGVLYASQSDGGPSIVNDYYAKAVAFDSLAVLRNEVAQRGWAINLKLGEFADASNDRAVRLHVVDRNGLPIEGLQGTLFAFRPQSVEMVASAELEAEGPGIYTVWLPVNARGLWDFELEGQYGASSLLHRMRTEVL